MYLGELGDRLELFSGRKVRAPQGKVVASSNCPRLGIRKVPQKRKPRAGKTAIAILPYTCGKAETVV